MLRSACAHHMSAKQQHIAILDRISLHLHNSQEMCWIKRRHSPLLLVLSWLIYIMKFSHTHTHKKPWQLDDYELVNLTDL